MTPFELIKADVTVPQAAERYGLKVGRNGMLRCLFHEDRHPSMKLNERYYYCFGCGAHGDVIDLTAKILGLPAGAAARVLMEDFHLDPNRSPPKTTGYRRPAIKEFRQDEAECASVLAEFLHLLQDWKVRYAPASPEEEWDDHYVLACQQTEAIEDAIDVLSVGALEDRVRLVDGLIKSGRLNRLRQTLNDIKEGNCYEEQKAG